MQSSSTLGTGGSSAGSDDTTTSSTVGTGASAAGAAQDDESNQDCPPGLANTDKKHGKAAEAC
jgi:hypothetical protein